MSSVDYLHQLRPKMSQRCVRSQHVKPQLGNWRLGQLKSARDMPSSIQWLRGSDSELGVFVSPMENTGAKELLGVFQPHMIVFIINSCCSLTMDGPNRKGGPIHKLV